MRMETNKTRTGWIDVLKLLGILAIFAGHLGFETGYLHDFVFWYHVPLFFFASGIFAGGQSETKFVDAVKRRFSQIMIPYFFLVILNMLLLAFTTDQDLMTFIRYGKQFVWGIRNQMPASSLWFFSCIFCTWLLFEILRRLLKKDFLVIPAAVVIYFLSITVFPHRPDQEPSWFWNIDSACYYLIYYAFGYALRSKLLAPRREAYGFKGYLRLAGAAVLAGYVLSVYFKDDRIGAFLYRTVPAVELIYPVVQAMLIIYLNVILAKILENFRPLCLAGQETLWLCGNEAIVKKALEAAAGIAGWQIQIVGALPAIIYASVMAVMILKAFLPAEKALYQKCRQYLIKLGIKWA